MNNSIIKLMCDNPKISWRANVDSEGNCYNGMFLAGMYLPSNNIFFQLPISMWEMLDGKLISTTNKAPKIEHIDQEKIIERLEYFINMERKNE